MMTVIGGMDCETKNIFTATISPRSFLMSSQSKLHSLVELSIDVSEEEHLTCSETTFRFDYLKKRTVLQRNSESKYGEKLTSYFTKQRIRV